MQGAFKIVVYGIVAKEHGGRDFCRRFHFLFKMRVVFPPFVKAYRNGAVGVANFQVVRNCVRRESVDVRLYPPYNQIRYVCNIHDYLPSFMT